MNNFIETDAVLEKNTKAASMWSSGGRFYDEISRGIESALLHTVERLAPISGESVLDIATGTGFTARRVAHRGAKTTGVDIADGLLEAAAAIADDESLTIEWRRGDAEHLPFADASFDAVVSTFGVMFASDQVAALKELDRVLRPGGRFGVAAWLPGSNAVDLRKVVAAFMPPSPAAPPPSPFNWGDPDWIKSSFGAGYDIGHEEAELFHRLPDAETAWDVYESGFGPVRAVAASLDDARRGELRAAFIDWVNRFRTGLGVAIPFQYLVTVGRKR